MESLRRAFRELGLLLIPVSCAGCGQVDVKWCAECAAVFGEPRRVEHAIDRLDRLDGVPPLPVWAISEYRSPVRDLIVAWKDRGRADLDPLMASKAGAAANALRGVLAPAGPLLVVPAPSRLSSRIDRARDHLSPVACAVARSLGTRSESLLAKRGRDQVGLGRRARGTVSVAVRERALARALARTCPDGPLRVLLLDDVVTSGATLAAAEQALNAHGIEVVGALVLAATPAPCAPQ